MKQSMLCAAVLVVCSACASVYAQDRTPVIDQREKNQQARIHQGVQSGELTRGEMRRLEAKEGKIKADEMNAKADGNVTPAERRHIRREQNRESRRIYRLKHNSRVRKE